LLPRRIRNHVAGTAFARGAIFARQRSLAAAIGRAESALLTDSDDDAARPLELKAALGRALVVAVLGRWSGVAPDPKADSASDGYASWWRSVLTTLRDHGVEQLVAGAIVAATPLFVTLRDLLSI